MKTDTYPTDETYSYSEDINCPHCGKEITGLREHFYCNDDDDEEEIECPHCDKIIEVEWAFRVTYTARVKG